MKQKTTQSSYESPLVRVRALNIEKGFAQSGGFGGINQAGSEMKEDGNYSYDL